MKKQNLILLTLVLVIVVLSILTTISQEPGSGFWGNANINENSAPIGAVVTAEISGVGVICGSYTIETAGTYGLVVSSAGIIPGCGTEGATVTFKINGDTATPTGIWHSGTNQYLDINVGTASDDCTVYTDWVSATRPHGAPGSCAGNGCVRNSTASGIYDQACCGGKVRSIITG